MNAIFIKTEIKDSPIFGRGLFPLEPVPRGKIVCFFALAGHLITEHQFVHAVASNTYDIIRRGNLRLAGKYFTYSTEPADHDFVNHSFEPNMVCHCGVVIALRDIPIGEELTLDYRTLIDDTDVGVYSDTKTSTPIKGFPAKETLLRTAQQLIDTIKNLENWTG